MLDLPNELQAEILVYLDINELTNVALCCKQLASVARIKYVRNRCVNNTFLDVPLNRWFVNKKDEYIEKIPLKLATLEEKAINSLYTGNDRYSKEDVKSRRISFIKHSPKYENVRDIIDLYDTTSFETSPHILFHQQIIPRISDILYSITSDIDVKISISAGMHDIVTEQLQAGKECLVLIPISLLPYAESFMEGDNQAAKLTYKWCKLNERDHKAVLCGGHNNILLCSGGAICSPILYND